ncbi:MAG: alpha-ketoglutarate-dependent dioxygenase AlkB [Gammaproteobacteria bacterium]|nr:alpha-ketoglutarate-dependent dioxygenase AlkB [Gammaproteobacteria bacterium]MCY4312905.1 alpha-ketoglutarate-dependent dioxygenase AlkB [Gammaproteobacteria bacterium]
MSPDEPRWLGLVTDNRRLFDALQDGWLRPYSSQGQVVGIGAYAKEKNLADVGHSIRVQIKLDASKLPDLDTQVLRGKNWQPCSYSDALNSTNQVLYWPGALPTFAILELSVSSEEERVRFTGMARFVANLVLPEKLVKVSTEIGNFDEEVSPPEITTAINIADDMDTIHGAIVMAVWGVPRIAPWLKILTASLDPEQSGLVNLAREVDAPWWQFPPWMAVRNKTNLEDFQARLWLATIEVFRAQIGGERVNSGLLLQQICEATSRGYPAEDGENELSKWMENTTGILQAESLIQLQNWRNCPVGIAIQLVLTRPEPSNFKTWFKDMPQLPPAIAWSAAVLCGLLHGYRRLDCQFRGNALQRELLSIHALRLCTEGAREMHWPSVTDKKPGWRRTADGIILSWDGHDFSTKTEHARGHWFNANFKNTTVAAEAQKLAADLNWPCVVQELILKDIELAYSGGGALRQCSEPDALVKVNGEVRVQLPKGLKIDEKLDIEQFLHLIATEAGKLPDPPKVSPVVETQIPQSDVPGLMYIPDFLSVDKEEELVKIIDSQQWGVELKRRVQHYGWRYDYKARQVDKSMYLGALPDWADELAHRLVSEKLVRQLPDQVIVNEYIGNQGITRHTDSNGFADDIVTISLCDSWQMIFRKKGVKGKKVERLLEQRSATVLSGPARYDWTHEIPKRKKEPLGSGKKRQDRKRCISLTFRKVAM